MLSFRVCCLQIKNFPFLYLVSIDMSFIHGKLSFASDSAYLLLFKSAFVPMVLVSNVAYIIHKCGLINQNHLLCVPWTIFYYDFLYITVFR